MKSAALELTLNGEMPAGARTLLAFRHMRAATIRPNPFQLVADLRGIAPIGRVAAGWPRFTCYPPMPGPTNPTPMP
jgi:hypothetical protein